MRHETGFFLRLAGRRSGLLIAIAACAALVRPGLAQEKPAAAPADPRVGLKGGLHDAAEAARNMERVASLPKPPGFFDAKQPAGEPTLPETPQKPEDKAVAEGLAEPDDSKVVPGVTAFDFSNSDIAFSGGYLFAGSFNGFNIYDLSKPDAPSLVASVVCPGGQGDVSVHGRLLVMSVEQTRGRVDCGTGGVKEKASPERFRGVRVFDISEVRKPRQVAAVQTCRGSHTHTLVTVPNDADNLYVYGSGTATVRSAAELADCAWNKDDPQTALFSIDVIKVPIASPEKAALVSRPRIFADPATGAVAGLWPGGNHGPGTQTTSVTNQCHDITVFPEAGLAAGACSGNGILLDISDPANPKRLDQVVDKNFAYWHSATFNNDGTKVIFTDEWGGGTRPRCRATDPPTWGANAIFDIVDRKLRFASHYKLPVPQTEQENCVAHNGSIVPVPGRDIMVQAWYQGGVSVFDFTDSSKPFEIAFFDRGPVDPQQLITAGFWSAYWYNGLIYASEMARGLDVFRLTPSEHLSKNEIDAAAARATEFNVQYQRRVKWDRSPGLMLAYLDQLVRIQGIKPPLAADVRLMAERAQKQQHGMEGRMRALAAALESEAGAANESAAWRLRAIAGMLNGSL
jgi:hypothetical protein